MPPVGCKSQERACKVTVDGGQLGEEVLKEQGGGGFIQGCQVQGGGGDGEKG